MSTVHKPLAMLGALARALKRLPSALMDAAAVQPPPGKPVQRPPVKLNRKQRRTLTARRGKLIRKAMKDAQRRAEQKAARERAKGGSSP